MFKVRGLFRWGRGGGGVEGTGPLYIFVLENASLAPDIKRKPKEIKDKKKH